jgi:hypothetical protein
MSGRWQLPCSWTPPRGRCTTSPTSGDDTLCGRFWEAQDGVVGAGNSPQTAYEDLLGKAGQAGRYR